MGYNLNLAEIYPKIAYPVTRGTPMINHLIQFKNLSWAKTFFDDKNSRLTGERKFTFSVTESRWAFLTGHVIDGMFR